MTSLVVLKILYVLAIFLILSDTLLFKYFSIYVYFGGGLDFAKNSPIWRHNNIRLRHCVNQVMPRSWKWYVHRSGDRSMNDFCSYEEGPNWENPDDC